MTYRCFFELTLLVIGGKWKPIILYKLAREEVLRFGELKRQSQGVTERMLSRQLRELENDGLIHREVYKQVPPKVEYSLTELGRSLIPILLNMREWGVEYESYLGGEALFSGEEYEPRDKLETGKY
jgi:DNA-binding HxlR family transcriptional regulator